MLFTLHKSLHKYCFITFITCNAYEYAIKAQCRYFQLNCYINYNVPNHSPLVLQFLFTC